MGRTVLDADCNRGAGASESRWTQLARRRTTYDAIEHMVRLDEVALDLPLWRQRELREHPRAAPRLREVVRQRRCEHDVGDHACGQPHARHRLQRGIVVERACQACPDARANRVDCASQLRIRDRAHGDPPNAINAPPQMSAGRKSDSLILYSRQARKLCTENAMRP
jgi:hypothetical protein